MKEEENEHRIIMRYNRIEELFKVEKAAYLY